MTRAARALTVTVGKDLIEARVSAFDTRVKRGWQAHALTKPTKIVEIVTVPESVFSEQSGSPAHQC
jgi:hypothetical protein